MVTSEAIVTLLKHRRLYGMPNFHLEVYDQIWLCRVCRCHVMNCDFQLYHRDQNRSSALSAQRSTLNATTDRSLSHVRTILRVDGGIYSFFFSFPTWYVYHQYSVPSQSGATTWSLAWSMTIGNSANAAVAWRLNRLTTAAVVKQVLPSSIYDVSHGENPRLIQISWQLVVKTHLPKLESLIFVMFSML